MEFMRQGGGVLAASAKTFDLNVRVNLGTVRLIEEVACFVCLQEPYYGCAWIHLAWSMWQMHTGSGCQTCSRAELRGCSNVSLDPLQEPCRQHLSEA